MHVLHITSWYPNVRAAHEAPFVERHIKALSLHCKNSVWHIDVRPSERWSFEHRSQGSDRTLLLYSPIRAAVFVEWAAAALILYAWLSRDRQLRPDALVFCIAYPNCAKLGLIKQFIRIPMLLSEHYSAYRINFNTNARGVARIRRIFRHKLPIVSVSKALGRDMERFAEAGPLEIHVVPNVVDTSHFGIDPTITPEEGRFFAMANWRLPKRPDILVEAMALLKSSGISAKLRIGGDGPQLDSVRQLVKSSGLEDRVELIGRRSPDEAADEMRRAHAFLHASDHETYSAVCVEALGCGTPVVATAVGGILEYMDAERGRLVQANDAHHWATTIMEAWTELLHMDRARISARILASGSPLQVGKLYYNVITEVVERRMYQDNVRMERPQDQADPHE